MTKNRLYTAYFWFNNKTIDTMLLNIRFYGDDTEEFVELEIVPAIQLILKL